MISKMLRLAAASLIVTGSLVAATSAPAAADVVQTFRNRGSGLCLDDSRDFHPRTFTCNGLNYQQWWVHVHPDQTRRLTNVNTQLCLGAQPINGTPTLVYGTCADNATFSWVVSRESNGIRLFNDRHNSFCLGDLGGNYAGGHYLGIVPCVVPVVANSTVWF